MPRKKLKVKDLNSGGNSANCGCCGSVIKKGGDQHSIKYGEREIYSLLFTNFKLKSDIICDYCHEQLNDTFKFRQDVIGRISALDIYSQPEVKIERLEIPEDYEDQKPIAFDFVRAKSESPIHDYGETHFDDFVQEQEEQIEIKPLVLIEDQIDDDFPPLPKKRKKKPMHEMNDGRRRSAITYNCILCQNFTSDNKKDYGQHVLKFHALNYDKFKLIDEDPRMRMVESRALPEPKCSVQCDYCGSIFKTKKILNGHLKTHIQIQVKCIDCNKTFRDNRVMVRHRNYYHGNGKRFFCYCGIEFDNKRDLIRCRYAHGKNLSSHICSDCDKPKKFREIRALLNHKNKFHCDGKRFWCVRCGAEHGNKEDQVFCTKSHYNDVLKEIIVKCPQCDKQLLHNSLKLHIGSIHSDVRDVVCHECAKRFSTVSRLTLHVKQVHNNGIKPYTCDLCNRTFAQKKSMRDHLIKVHATRSINRKKHECPICLKICFENKERHLAQVHPNGFDNGVKVNRETNLYHCPKCIQTFAQMKAYVWHVNENLCENYGDFEIDEGQSGDGKKLCVYTKGKFPCKICNSVQKTLARLRRHMYYIHSGEVKCMLCDKMLPCKRALIGHLRKVHDTNYTAIVGVGPTKQRYKQPLC